MRREEISRRQFLKIIKELNGNYIYNDHGRMVKFDLTYLDEMKKYRQLLSAFSSINVEQIEWLSNVRVKNSHLPEGVVICDRTPVGVIYPHYFEGYKSLFHTNQEDSKLMLDNMSTAVENNLELIDAGVVNTDFAAKNVLYSGKHVELIDLSGKHIKRGLYNDNYEPAYSYFIPDMYKIIGTKLIGLYGVEETKRILKELKESIPNGYYREKPMEIIEGIDKMRVLK